MASLSSTLAWKIPWTEESGRLQSMGSWRVRPDWATLCSLLTFMHWRRKWQPTPVFLPGNSHGRKSLVGCHLWGHTESDLAASEINDGLVHMSVKPTDNKNFYIKNEKSMAARVLISYRKLTLSYGTNGTLSLIKWKSYRIYHNVRYIYSTTKD